MTFTPEGPAFVDATEAYRRLWSDEGANIVATFESITRDLDEHRVLYLFLYEVWESLWGRQFADQQVLAESAQRGVYDYESAWRWALSLTPEQRAARFADVLRTNGR